MAPMPPSIISGVRIGTLGVAIDPWISVDLLNASLKLGKTPEIVKPGTIFVALPDNHSARPSEKFKA